MKCPVCEEAMRGIDVPKYQLYVCDPCEETVQIQSDGTPLILGHLLEKVSFGDDRVKAAISKPVVTSIKGLIDTFDDIAFRVNMDMASAGAHFQAVLVRAQNRLDYVIGQITGLDLASDDMGEVLDALRELRALVSPTGQQGIRETSNAATS